MENGVNSMRIRMFGPFEVTLDGCPLAKLRSRKGYWLLALLALRHGREVTREWLAETLWPDSLVEDAYRSLRQSLGDLRKALGSQSYRLEAPTPRTLRLNLQGALVDLIAFDAAAEGGDRASREEMVANYRGALLEGCSEIWAFPERENRRHAYLGALRGLTDEALANGEPTQAARLLRLAVAEEPLSEPTTYELMCALERSGDLNAAIQVYRDLVRLLHSHDVKAIPEPRTRDLYARLLEARSGDMAALRVPGATAASPHSLPHSSRRPLGEDDEPIDESQQDGDQEEATAEPHSLRTPERPASPPPAFHSVPYPVASPWYRQALRRVMTAGTVALLLAIGYLAGHRGAGAPSIARKPSKPALYVPSAKTLWVARYVPASDEIDNGEPTAMTTDAAGNVYITGFIRTTHNDVDYLTLKYSPDGQLLWRRRYNGPGNDMDRARSIAVDSDGNVYVTGESDNGKGNNTSRLSGLDWATVKYDASGKQLWVARYNGPDDGEDAPVKVCVDRSGCVIVAGTSMRRARGQGCDPYTLDFVTVKYYPDGSQAWAKRIAAPGCLKAVVNDMALDSPGNVFVTGWIHGLHNFNAAKQDILTVKYGVSGDELWRKTYLGRGIGNAVPRRIAVDAAGNVTVVGVQYDGDVLNNGSQEDIVTLRYDSDGSLKWKSLWDDSWQRDFATGLALDDLGNAYVAGFTGVHANDYATLKYDHNGTRMWQGTYNGVAGEDDVATGIAVDHVAGVIVTGRSNSGDANQGTGTGYDYVTLKYDPTGRVLWKGVYDGNSRGDWAVAVAVDQNNCVLVTGQSDEKKQGHTITTVKYAP